MAGGPEISGSDSIKAVDIVCLHYFFLAGWLAGGRSLPCAKS